MKLRPILLAAPLALAACNGAEKGAEGERKTAAGEVLGGTITDDMLPLDTVTSQSPPMHESAGGEDGDPAADKANAPPKDSNEGPGEPPRDPAPEPSAPASEEPAE